MRSFSGSPDRRRRSLASIASHLGFARRSELVAQGLAPVTKNDHHRRRNGPRAASYRSIKNRKLSDFPEGKEWDPTKNGDLRPEDVNAGSDHPSWWLCAVDPSHEWKQTVVERTARQSRCPFCINRRLCITNCLTTVRPDLAIEWDAEPS